MKSFREFLSEDAVKAQQSWQDWMKANPQEFNRGGKFYGKAGTNAATSANERVKQASKDFMKTYMKTGKPPAGFEVKSTTVPGGNKSDSPFSGKPQPQPSQPSGGSTQTNTNQPSGSRSGPSGGSTQTNTNQPSGSRSGPSGGTNTNRAGAGSGPSGGSTTPNSVRRPNPYRATGSGRTEIPRNPTNPGRGPTSLRTVMNTARNLKNVKPSSVPGLKSGGVLSGVVDTALEKSKGSSWLRSLAKGTTTALGTVAGGTLGGAAGTLVAPGAGTAVGGYAGQAAGAAAASKAFDVVAGKNAVERAADRLANRQRQAGGGLAGIGGKTTFSKAKDGTGFMSTGVGAQRKTVSLAKTSVVKDPKTGKLEAGNLAFKDGKAVYKRAAAPGEGTSNPFERIGRFVNPGAYKANDAKLAQQKLQAAVKSDVKRQQALGVKGSKNLVGAKIVGPKIVGPKIVGPGK